MTTREQPKRTYKLDKAVAFVLEPNSDMSDLEDSEDDEYNDLLQSDGASDDDSENNEAKCENATTSRLTFFCFVCISQGK